MKRTWTIEQINKVKELHATHTARQIAQIINKPLGAVKAKIAHLKLYKLQDWSESEINYLKENYANTRTDELAKHLNRNITGVYNMAFSLKLKKSKEFLSTPESGVFVKGHKKGGNTVFKKGHNSWNKGTKGLTKSNKTSFKKGNLPGNTKVDGAVSKRADGYLWVRVAKSVWKQLHRVIWEKYNGTIPEGYCVQFKDKNPMNCDPDNLYIIDRHEQMKENSMHNLPEDIKKVIQLKGVLKRTINQTLKNS